MTDSTYRRSYIRYTQWARGSTPAQQRAMAKQVAKRDRSAGKKTDRVIHKGKTYYRVGSAFDDRGSAVRSVKWRRTQFHQDARLRTEYWVGGKWVPRSKLPRSSSSRSRRRR